MAREELKSHLRVLPAHSLQESVRWKVVFAGLVIALLSYLIMVALGMAVGGASLSRVVQGEYTAERFGLGVAAWMVLSMVVSLFVGAYTASRLGNLVVARVGRSQGGVIAGLFFALMLSQVGLWLGFGGLNSSIATLGNTMNEISQASEAQAVMADALDGLGFREPSEKVVATVSARVLQGDEEGAITYLSRMAGITRAEALERIDMVRADFHQAAVDAGTQAADALEVTGWTLFASLVLGALASIAGGMTGVRVNLRKPYAVFRRRITREENVA